MAEGYCIEDITEGMSASYEKTVTEAVVAAFAEISGDDNPLHLDAAYAKGTPFRERIAHGMLSAGFISAVLGTKLPGPGGVYMRQSLQFRAPVRIGDHVVATCTVTAIDRDRRRVTFDCRCKVGDTEVIRGEALILVPSRS